MISRRPLPRCTSSSLLFLLAPHSRILLPPTTTHLIRLASRTSAKKAHRRTPLPPPTAPSQPPPPTPSTITLVHDSKRNNKRSIPDVSDDAREDGRVLVYTGALNNWLDKFRLFAGFMTGVPLMALPWVQVSSVVPIEQTVGLVGLACSIPWIATHIIFKNYVTRMYRYPAPPSAQTPSPSTNKKKSQTTNHNHHHLPAFSSPHAALAFETRTLWGSKRETLVRVSNLRYNPKWVLRVWQAIPDPESGYRKTKSLFVEPRLIRDDAVLKGLWTQVQRQSPAVDQEATWFHRFTTDTVDGEGDMAATATGGPPAGATPPPGTITPSPTPTPSESSSPTKAK
ncbi:hypothetical protein HDU87_003075 [Geranomyces variabilis]|uniref:Uncharacterized protein n=1 Tax=Geranomyces variabilis TaxID=109894 RepID=A0AAD5TKF9_9FUNG|nr:hypothetical protein HDU87_003075 [Geranomyces variabilis]